MLTGSLPGSVVNNGVLALDPSATQALTMPGVISSGGNLVMLGNGVATLTASSTYSGQTLISSGTLQFGNGASLSSSSTITDNGTLAFANGGTLRQGVNFIRPPSQVVAGCSFRRLGDFERRKHLRRRHHGQRRHARP